MPAEQEASDVVTVAQRPRLPVGIWVLGFVSMLMDISSEMIHALLPVYLTVGLGATALVWAKDGDRPSRSSVARITALLGTPRRSAPERANHPVATPSPRRVVLRQVSRHQSRATRLDLPLQDKPSPASKDASRRLRTDRILHGFFLLSLAGKAALGLLQLATAALLALGILDRLPELAQRLVQAELAEDPNDFLAAKLLEVAGRAPSADTGFFTIYFAAHGLLHVLVVVALLMGSVWAYPAALAVLCAFVFYQMAEWAAVGGSMLLVLSAIDIAVIALTVREWRQKRP